MIQVGDLFRGTSNTFDGRIEVIAVKSPIGKLTVRLTKQYLPNGSFHQWTENDWVLQHVLWGLEKGDYIRATRKDFPNYPPLYLDPPEMWEQYNKGRE